MCIEICCKKFKLQFFCCGINGPLDWKNFTFDTENVPSSCQYKYPPYVYKVGCLEVYGKYIKSIIFNLEMVGFGTGLVQVSNNSYKF